MARLKTGVGDVIDRSCDGAVVAFAVWTLLYEIGYFAGLNAWLLTRVWAVLALVCLAGTFWLAGRGPGGREPGTAAQPSPGPASDGQPRGQLVAVSVAIVGACALAAARSHDPLVFWPMWALAGAALLFLAVRTPRTPETSPTSREPSTLTHLGALAISTGLAAWSLVLWRGDTDDIYYVNLSTWVAQRGTFPTRDTMFGAQTHDSVYGGGFQISSIEALYGGLAQLTGLHAATVTYLVAAPLLAAFTGWCLWRLVRTWAPRRLLLVLGIAVAVIVFSSTTAVGNISVPRMWQGKSVAIAALVPLVWVHLTRWFEQRRRYDLGMLLVLGISLIGLTSSGILLAVPISVGVVLVGWWLRDVRPMVLAAVALSLFPVFMGLVVMVLGEPVGDNAAARTLSTPRTFYRVFMPAGSPLHVAWLPGLLPALLLLGVLLSPMLVRRGVPRALAAISGLICLGAVAPGMVDLIDRATGSGPVVWRILLCAPVPVLVGLIATTGRGRVAIGISTALVAVLLAGGIPIATRSTEPVSAAFDQPRWKLDADALERARQVLALSRPRGPILMPRSEMSALTIQTTRAHAVNPRGFYTEVLPEELHPTERLALTRLAMGSGRGLSAQEVDEALAAVHVSLACLPEQPARNLRKVRRAGYGDPVAVSGLLCLRRL